jgi:hypothetical protein
MHALSGVCVHENTFKFPAIFQLVRKLPLFMESGADVSLSLVKVKKIFTSSYQF